MPKANRNLVINRLVHYVTGFSVQRKCYPAVVVDVRTAESVDLQVFKPADKDGTVGGVGVLHGMEVGQWHWNDECPYEKRAKASVPQLQDRPVKHETYADELP